METDTWQCSTCHRTVARRLKTCPRCAAAATSGTPSSSPGAAPVRLASLQHVVGLRAIHIGDTVSVTAERLCEQSAGPETASTDSASSSTWAQTITAAREEAEAELRREIARLGANFGLGLEFETTSLATPLGLRVAVTAHATPCQLERDKEDGATTTFSSAPQWSFGVGVGFMDIQ